MKQARFQAYSHLLLIAAMVLALVAYWTGLHGPLLLDDAPILGILKNWLAGQAPLADVLFGNGSWINNRALAMLSFAANVYFFGYDPFWFKFGNLIAHIGCGALGFVFVRSALRHDPELAPQAPLVAAIIAAVWLLHPLNVSTVLYAVQRMAQLATACCLAGLWLYVVLRTRLQNNAGRGNTAILFTLIPLLTLLGIQAKQNAAILPILCLIVEAAYFASLGKRPVPVRWFFRLSVLLPSVVAILAIALKPDLIASGYGEYPFSMYERLLSETRALSYYIWMTVAPYSPAMGVYTDDFVVSTRLLHPPTTLAASLFLLGFTLVALKVRKSAPSFYAGWLLFLAGHAIEGSILPLELYYEHRNYLPSFGLLLVFASIGSILGKKLNSLGIRTNRIAVVGLASALLMLGIMTHGRARVWSDPQSLYRTTYQHHPNSIRAAVSLIGITAETGDYERSNALMNESIARTSDPKVKGQLLLFRVWLNCMTHNEASLSDLHRALQLLPPHIDLTTFLMFNYARQNIENGSCKGISLRELADALASAADGASTQREDAWPKWLTRSKSAAIYARIGAWDDALEQARHGWQPTTDAAGAELLVRLLLRKTLTEEAEQVYRQAVDRSTDTPEDIAGLRRIRQMIDASIEEVGRPDQRPN